MPKHSSETDGGPLDHTPTTGTICVPLVNPLVVFTGTPGPLIPSLSLPLSSSLNTRHRLPPYLSLTTTRTHTTYSLSLFIRSKNPKQDSLTFFFLLSPIMPIGPRGDLGSVSNWTDLKYCEDT